VLWRRGVMGRGGAAPAPRKGGRVRHEGLPCGPRAGCPLGGGASGLRALLAPSLCQCVPVFTLDAQTCTSVGVFWPGRRQGLLLRAEP
jgi:hypothetical protein